MMTSFINMSPDQIFGCLIAAIVAMGGAMAWLHKDAVGRGDKHAESIKKDFASHKESTKKTIENLDSRLFDALQKKQDAELKAVKFEMQARTPCGIAECPRRTTFSIGEPSGPDVL